MANNMKENKKSKKRMKLILVIVGILLFLCVLTFISYKMFFDKEKIIIDYGDELVKIEISDDINSTVVLPEPKKKEGYKFSYYKINGELFNENSVSDIRRSITLYPVYIKEDTEVTNVTFELDESYDKETITVDFVKGGEIILPAVPQKHRYIFIGWKDSKGNFVHNGDILTEDLMIIIPIWEENKNISKDGYTCEYEYDAVCEINNKYECECKKQGNAIIESYQCSAGTYSEKENKCIIKEDATPTCNTGTYDEASGGCRVTTNTIKKCAKGDLIQGMCYYNAIPGWDSAEAACVGFYFGLIANKCYRSEAKPVTACPSGYKLESGTCYKIVKADMCKSGYELIEEDGKKVCISKINKTPVYKCNEGYTLEDYLCIQKYTTSSEYKSENN